MPLTLVVSPFIADSCGNTTTTKIKKRNSKERGKPTNIIPIDMEKT